jgi:hypothetical protein
MKMHSFPFAFLLLKDFLRFLKESKIREPPVLENNMWASEIDLLFNTTTSSLSRNLVYQSNKCLALRNDSLQIKEVFGSFVMEVSVAQVVYSLLGKSNCMCPDIDQKESEKKENISDIIHRIESQLPLETRVQANESQKDGNNTTHLFCSFREKERHKSSTHLHVFFQRTRQ